MAKHTETKAYKAAIKAYQHERNKIADRERSFLKRGYTLGKTFIPETIPEIKKQGLTTQQIKKLTKELQQITPAKMYTEAQFMTEEGELVSGFRGREIERSKAAKKARKKKEYTPVEIDTTYFGGEAGYEDVVKLHQEYKTREEIVAKDERFAKERDTAYYNSINRIAQRLEEDFYNNMGGFIYGKKGYATFIHYDFDSDKHNILRMWKDISDEYSQTPIGMSALINYINENEDKISNVLIQIQQASKQEEYVSALTELYSLLHVTAPTQQDLIDFFDREHL